MKSLQKTKEPAWLVDAQPASAPHKTNPATIIHTLEPVKKADGRKRGSDRTQMVWYYIWGEKDIPRETRTVFICKQRAGRAPRSYSVVVAGVEGPVCFHPLAAGNPVARLRMEKAGACTPLPTSFLAAQCVRVGTIHSLKALRVIVRLLGVNVDVHAVRAAAAVRAHNRQSIAFKGGRENGNKRRLTSWKLSALKHTTCGRKRLLCLDHLSLGSVGISH